MAKNFYIQGDPSRAKEIKAAFEKLGIDPLDSNFDCETIIYASIGNCVQSFGYSVNLLHILKTHPDYQELELPVDHKFKVGDDIKIGNTIETIAEVDLATRSYCCESGRTIWFENQDLWHLVPKPHYDISNFKPKQWVLVRDDDEWEWALTRFSYLSNGSSSLFVCINGASFQQCIPFEGNEHMLGTTDMPSEEYINW